MDKTLLHKKRERSLVVMEMRDHGGEFVALDSQKMAIAYGATEGDLEAKLSAQGLRLNDFVISRVPEWDCGFVF